MTKPPYRWPAEWEPQAAVWLSWPHNLNTWPGHFEPVPRAFAAFVRAVAEFTPVCLLASGAVASDAEKHLRGIKQVQLFDVPTNDCWIRDYGPTFVHDQAGKVVGVDWDYNAWGGKYPPWDADRVAAQSILQQIKLPRIAGGLCLEGGAIETNGEGILMTTPECILTDTRNPGIDQAAAERILSERLGVHTFLWLRGGGIEGDDTDGHIDQLARFVARDHIVCATSHSASDSNHEPLQRIWSQLKTWGSAHHVQITSLPQPRPRYINDQRVPESYCNFLITNRLVLVPTFDDPSSDDRAIGILREAMPQHEVVGLRASDLTWGLGAFHCASQQQLWDTCGIGVSPVIEREA